MLWISYAKSIPSPFPKQKYTVNVTCAGAYLFKELQGDLFPAVTSTAVKNFSSQVSNSIIGP
jgi:hypothetical protein